MADLTIVGELLATGKADAPLQLLTGRLDGGRLYLDTNPDNALTADNAAGPLLDGQRVYCLHQDQQLTIIGPVRSWPEPAAGSNTNGNWWRSPDGLQICWVHTTTVRANTAPYGTLHQSRWQWTFPMPFIGQPVASCPLWQWSTGASWGTLSGPPSTTSALLRGIDAVARTVADPLTICATAIGRWRN